MILDLKTKIDGFLKNEGFNLIRYSDLATYLSEQPVGIVEYAPTTTTDRVLLVGFNITLLSNNPDSYAAYVNTLWALTREIGYTEQFVVNPVDNVHPGLYGCLANIVFKVPVSTLCKPSKYVQTP